MREIKFRAWDKENQTMYNWRTIMQYPLAYTFCSDIIAPMQYTGLKDKNGVEIYEGDIVDCKGDIGSVVIEDGVTIIYRTINNIPQMSLLLNVAYKCEVIGTLYENPELLEV